MGKTWQYESLMKYVQTCTRETNYEYKVVASPLLKCIPHSTSKNSHCRESLCKKCSKPKRPMLRKDPCGRRKTLVAELGVANCVAAGTSFPPAAVFHWPPAIRAGRGGAGRSGARHGGAEQGGAEQGGAEQGRRQWRAVAAPVFRQQQFSSGHPPIRAPPASTIGHPERNSDQEALRSAGGQRKTAAGGKLVLAATQSATPSSATSVFRWPHGSFCSTGLSSAHPPFRPASHPVLASAAGASPAHTSCQCQRYYSHLLPAPGPSPDLLALSAGVVRDGSHLLHQLLVTDPLTPAAGT
ncbi:hypothetical protein QTO34_010502 [Cnephaeus nilssonii]|uniref:Uncharacterized protein n=1 Tax=Cnephaeus nilssonii TaxID=3371016 RepID=A0AA40LFW0_CNENI|nr:hypothetical protein QTO34_010502 [Eptesicus nilssonii]